MMALDRTRLLQAATSFCNAFAAQSELSVVLGHFSDSSGTFAMEHGLPRLAPFLGRRFTGIEEIKDYFALISEELSYSDMLFVDYIVDAEERKVSVRGTARFECKSTGQGWNEVFMYALAFDDSLKVKAYEIWADSGAAYLAKKGKLI